MLPGVATPPVVHEQVEDLLLFLPGFRLADRPKLNPEARTVAGAEEVVDDRRDGGSGTVDTPERARPTGPTACVLYIEDNPSNVALVRGIFELRPALSLLVASDGISGLAIARERRPDLVLLDLSLPDIDGLDVFERLQRDPPTASMRCVALSADATAARIEEIRAKGFIDYWTKPIDVTRFLSDLDRLLADPTSAAP